MPRPRAKSWNASLFQEHAVEWVRLTDLQLVVGTPDVDGPGNVARPVGHRIHDREDDQLGVPGVDELLQLLGRDEGLASLVSLVFLLGDGGATQARRAAATTTASIARCRLIGFLPRSVRPLAEALSRGPID